MAADRFYEDHRACPPKGRRNRPLELQTETEIGYRIIIRNTVHDLLQGFSVCRIFSVLYPAAYKIAHDSSEIVMSGVGQKTSGVSEHADKVAQAP